MKSIQGHTQFHAIHRLLDRDSWLWLLPAPMEI